MPLPVVNKWPSKYERGAKRANVRNDDAESDWFVGFGKDESCQFEGTWWDMICFARNVLANENTKTCAPSFYMPELKNDNYTGPRPYVMGSESNPELSGPGKDQNHGK